MTRIIEFGDPRYQRFAELAERLAHLPREERAAAIHRALVREHNEGLEAAERALGQSDVPLIESIKSLAASELQAVVDEASASGLVATFRELNHMSTPSGAASNCDGHRGKFSVMRPVSRREERRMLTEMLETARGLRPFIPSKVGALARVKAQLRAAKCPVPSPRRIPAGLTKRAIEAARRGETVEVSIDEL